MISNRILSDPKQVKIAYNCVNGLDLDIPKYKI